MTTETKPSSGGHPKRGVTRRQLHISQTVTRTLDFSMYKGPSDFARAEKIANRRTDDRGPSNSQGSRRDRALLGEGVRIEGSGTPPNAASGTKVPASIPNSTLLEHIAISRFFHHYVSSQRTFCRLDLDFTSCVIDNAPMRSALAEIIIALGILTLPRKSQASVMAARLRYARALRLTNEALRDKCEVKSDGVLMAVILLSFFETTPNDEHSLASWTAHLDGARRLLEIRGHETLQRGPTYRMFNMVRTQIILNCVMTMQPVPQDIVDLSTQISETQEAEEKAGSQLLLLFVRLCNLLATSRHASYLKREDTLSQARSLDDDLISWSSTLPSSFEYFTEPETTYTNTYSGYYEVYSSLFAAEIWMLYRSTRLGVNGIIVGQQRLFEEERVGLFERQETSSFENLFDSHNSSDLEPRSAVLESLRHDICASMPYMLGRHAGCQTITDIPLSKRTPALHYLMNMLNTTGITKEMTDWTMVQIAELQADEETDSGAVWMSRSIRGACN